MQTPYDAVIFDLDGTLLNTLEDLRDAVNHALTFAGLPTRTTEEIRTFIGNGVPTLIRRSVAPVTDEEVLQGVHNDFLAYYKIHCEDKTCPYDGVGALLCALQAAGIPAAIVSNKADFAVQLLAEKYFPGQLALSLGARDELPRKPDPAMLLFAVEKLGAAHPLYVGDSDVDVKTAAAAGVEGIFVTWGYRDRAALAAAGATRFADTAEELLRRITGA